MSAVRCKFMVVDKKVTLSDKMLMFSVILSPVTSGSPENDAFYQYKPGGSLVLATINAAAAEQLQVGREYYIDITPADAR
jgi:hypothetical protein